jgi:hypothetical protein
MVFDCFLLSINVQSANWMIGTGQGVWVSGSQIHVGRGRKHSLFQAGLPGKGAISVTNMADDLAGHVPAFFMSLCLWLWTSFFLFLHLSFFLSRPDDFFKNFKIFRQFPRSSFHWIRYGRGLSLSVQLDPATTLRQQLRKVRLLRCGWRAVRSRCFFGWLKTTVTIGVVHITPGCKINIYRCIIYEYSTSQLMSLFVCLLVGLLVCWFVRSFVCLFVCLLVCPLQH